MMHYVISPFRTVFAWGKEAVAWIWRSMVYLFEIFVAVIVMIDELSLLLSAAETFIHISGYPWRCLLPLSPSWCVVSAPLSWSGLLLLVGYLILILTLLVAFPLVAFLLARDGVGRIRAWSRDPNRQSLLQLRRERAQLAYLLVLAQEENEYASYWKDGSFTSTQVPGTHPISRFAGPWSFFYVTLSNYLRLPPAEEHRDVLHQASLPAASEAEPAVAAYTVTLFGKPRLLVKGTKTIEVALKLRQQEVLAYLGTVAREKECSRDDLIAAIHEKRDEQRKVNSHRDALDYDVRVLRRSVEAVCQQAEVSYHDPVDVTNRGPGAFYRLASAYEVTDIAQFERIAERMEQLKRDPQADQNVQEVRNAYESVLASYGEGFVGQQVQKEQTGSWAKVSYRQYRSQYHELLWNVAEYEYALSQQQQGEEKNASLRQAAKLYEQCAQLTAPSREELQQGNAAPLSEHALRQCLTVYGLLSDLSLVQLTYYHYLKTMQRRYRAWQPEPQTVRVFETVMGTSHQEIQRNTPPTSPGENNGGDALRGTSPTQ